MFLRVARAMHETTGGSGNALKGNGRKNSTSKNKGASNNKTQKKASGALNALKNKGIKK